ncbi:TetR family transcriptional regulator [Reinekea blandensis]|uniref:Transcriptional regulator n=1 Tax=Reinekea blandensis MED297 TaxID=314283 RepID=A4BHY0_9GAMM|nr:TetR family transcriptional regulator [Reinekea blandensis]EAR08252.1 Transcriptional regulator [Reinekea sp. MED297] [Reinekea blandensis MED297]
MKRARAPEQKTARRSHILTVATQCFLENPTRLPSVAQVADASGIAKGTVYLYFKTKEEIFLEVFIVQLQTLLSDLPQRPIAADIEFSSQLTERLLNTQKEQPVFLPLASRLHTILEQNLPVDSLKTFKRNLCQLLAESGKVIDSAYHYPAGFSERALLHSYAALIGLWQMLQWPEVLHPVRNRPEYAPLQRDFDQELHHILTLVWHHPA